MAGRREEHEQCECHQCQPADLSECVVRKKGILARIQPVGCNPDEHRNQGKKQYVSGRGHKLAGVDLAKREQTQSADHIAEEGT